MTNKKSTQVTIVSDMVLKLLFKFKRHYSIE
jgi:hypothetical protein